MTVGSRGVGVVVLALALAGPLALGAAPPCAPAPQHSCCAAATACCCGDAGECACRPESERQPSAPEPATPQRQGDDQKAPPAMPAAASASLDGLAPAAEAPPATRAGRDAAAPPAERAVLRC